jgi:hypothetical protein
MSQRFFIDFVGLKLPMLPGRVRLSPGRIFPFGLIKRLSGRANLINFSGLRLHSLPRKIAIVLRLGGASYGRSGVIHQASAEGPPQRELKIVNDSARAAG